VRPGADQEYFARIAAQDREWFFPLESTEIKTARVAATELAARLRRQGWPTVLRACPREFTWGIFWSQNPDICSYCTLISDTVSRMPPPAVPSAGVAVFVIEPEAAVLRSLAHWIGRNPGCCFAGGARSATDALAHPAYSCAAVVLYNGLLPHFEPGSNAPIVIRYFICKDSTAFFQSIWCACGVYLLRRQKASEILRPLVTIRAGRDPLFHFRQWLAPDPDRSGHSISEQLTEREHDILQNLCRGCVDKEIARHLQISAWTVRNHLKSIYRKLSVHSRTEAVLKYMQK
jgi:DNA-binding CsgD family transcriptional regulator